MTLPAERPVVLVGVGGLLQLNFLMASPPAGSSGA